MAFEKYIPIEKKAKQPMARIRPSGLISLDGDSVEKFAVKEATHAVLFFDKPRKILGVQLTNNGAEEGALMISKRRNSMTIKAPDFFFAFNLVIDKPMVFPVSQHRDGKLLLDLKSVKRRRGRRPKTS